MGSLNEPRCSMRLRLTLAALQFRCIFYASLVRRTLTRRQNGLVALRTNGWEQVARKGSHLPLSTPWKLGASTCVVTNREERQARQAEGKAKVDALRKAIAGGG